MSELVCHLQKLKENRQREEKTLSICYENIDFFHLYNVLS